MSQTVCEIYKLLNKRKLISFEITKESFTKVDSLVHNINSEYFGKEIYSNNEEKSVAYLYFLIKNHPFTDGNKRTAVLCFEVLCQLNGLQPKYDGYTLDELAVYIERQQTKDHQDLIKRLSKITF